MYAVEFTRDAQADLSRLDNTTAQRVLDRIRWLAENYDLIRHMPSLDSGKACSASAQEITESSTPVTLVNGR